MAGRCYNNRKHEGPFYGYVLHGVGNVKLCMDCRDMYQSHESESKTGPCTVKHRGKPCGRTRRNGVCPCPDC